MGLGEHIRKQLGEGRPSNPIRKLQESNDELTPILIQPGAGHVLRAFGEEITIRLSGSETQGRLALWTEITPPGGGPPPHYHEREDECFIVEEGRVGFFANGAWQELSPGGTAFMPRGLVHTFKNVGDTPSRMTISTSPSGFETFFARCHEEFAKTGAPEMARITAIAAEHGIHFVQDCTASS